MYAVLPIIRDRFLLKFDIFFSQISINIYLIPSSSSMMYITDAYNYTYAPLYKIDIFCKHQYDMIMLFLS